LDWIEQGLTPHPAHYIGHFEGGLHSQSLDCEDTETLMSVLMSSKISNAAS